MTERTVTREEIINTLFNTLEPLDFVYGMWQCGSAAFKRVDEWSDIDIVVDVEDEKLMDVFKFTDESLEKLLPIEDSFESPQPMSQGAYQKVYKLKGLSKFLLIEICAIKHSSPQKFLEKEIHNDVFIHFDKGNVTDIEPIDKDKFAKKIEDRISQLDSLFNIYQNLIEKELNRGNYIEAMAFYHGFTLNPLLELLRIKYKPFRYNFRTRYVYYDLPKDVVDKLHDFYFIGDPKELKFKYEAGKVWFNELMEELKGIKIKNIL